MSFASGIYISQIQRTAFYSLNPPNATVPVSFFLMISLCSTDPEKACCLCSMIHFYETFLEDLD